MSGGGGEGVSPGGGEAPSGIGVLPSGAPLGGFVCTELKLTKLKYICTEMDERRYCFFFHGVDLVI